jgi:hypothetical protein
LIVYSFDLIFDMNDRNPLYLAVIFVVFLVGKAFWVQLDIANEFQNGFVSVQSTLLLLS